MFCIGLYHCSAAGRTWKITRFSLTPNRVSPYHSHSQPERDEMTNRLHRGVGCGCVGVLISISTLFGQEPAPDANARPAAMVYASGGVRLNGANVPRSSAVFAGDRLSSSADGAFTLTLAGSTITGGPNALLRYVGTAIQLTSGMISIATTRGLVTETGALRIAPANTEAKYEVTRMEPKTVITAREGMLTIAEDGVVTQVLPGQTVEREDPRNRRRAAAAVPGSHAKVYAGVTAAAAGAAVVTVLTTRLPASPQRP